jgi:hypothetical protein
MKTKVLFFLFVFFTLVSRSQVNTNDTATYVYCDVMCTSKALSNVADALAVNIFIDFGNGEIYGPENPIKDLKTKEAFNFSSAPDILNYLDKKGWRIVTSSSLAEFTGGIRERWVTYYILKKKKFQS